MYVRLFLRTLKNTKRATKLVSMTMEELESCTIKKKLEEKTQQMTRSIRIIVVFLVICFLPYVVWLNYYYIVITTRAESDGHYKVYPIEVMRFKC